jgi:RNA polymerase sigma-70 factor (ECF subfamily)
MSPRSLLLAPGLPLTPRHDGVGSRPGSDLPAPHLQARDVSDAGAVRAERQAEDAVLVAATLRGDEDAFRRLVEKYQKPVYWIAHDVLLDADEARDVAQETFLRVHGALATFDPKRDFLNWLYRIARNISIDALRRRRRRAAPVEDLTTVPAAAREDAPAQREVRGRVEAVLAEMPVDYRLALTLKEILGLSPREIAAITDTSYPTARWRLHRARLLFKRLWEERYGLPSFDETSS